MPRPTATSWLDQLGDFGVLENRSSLADVIGGGREAVLHRRQQVDRCQVGGLDEDAERKVGFGAQGQHGLQRAKFVVGQPHQGLVDGRGILPIGRGLQRHGKRKGDVVRDRDHFFGEFPMRLAQFADQRDTGIGDLLALGHGLLEPCQVFKNAAGSDVELGGVFGAEQAEGAFHLLARCRERLEGVAALGVICRGKQARRGRTDIARRLDDI